MSISGMRLSKIRIKIGKRSQGPTSGTQFSQVGLTKKEFRKAEETLEGVGLTSKRFSQEEEVVSCVRC